MTPDEMREYLESREHLRSELSLSIRERARKYAWLPDH